MATYYAMTLDTEEQWQWHVTYPTSDYTLDNIFELPRFQELCAGHGVKTTYFTNWAVMDNSDTRAVMLALGQRADVEIGMHIHPWNTPPIESHGQVGAHESFLANLPAEQIRAKLSSVYDLFTDADLRPRSFRGGRYSSGGLIHQFLQDKGFAADSSIVPYTTWQDPGAADFRGRGIEPSRIAPVAADKPALWQIPLTVGFTRGNFDFWAKWYNRIKYSPLSRLRLIGLAERLGLVKRIWLNFDFTPAGEMLDLLHVVRRMHLPYVCLTIHTSSLMAGGNPYSRTEEDVKRLGANVDEVFGAIGRWPEFEPVTISELAGKLEANHHARDRH